MASGESGLCTDAAPKTTLSSRRLANRHATHLLGRRWCGRNLLLRGLRPPPGRGAAGGRPGAADETTRTPPAHSNGWSRPKAGAGRPAAVPARASAARSSPWCPARSGRSRERERGSGASAGLCYCRHLSCTRGTADCPPWSHGSPHTQRLRCGAQPSRPRAGGANPTCAARFACIHTPHWRLAPLATISLLAASRCVSLPAGVPAPVGTHPTPPRPT